MGINMTAILKRNTTIFTAATTTRLLFKQAGNYCLSYLL